MLLTEVTSGHLMWLHSCGGAEGLGWGFLGCGVSATPLSSLRPEAISLLRKVPHP